LALLLAGGALWLILAASAAYADGGPHQLAVNNGSAGLSGDCAACHRAHTAQAANLLKSSMPGLCLTCHDGAGATTDVEDGVQYTPAGSGFQQSAVLGALRGGGFQYALMDASNASRLSYSSRGSITLTLGAVPASGAITMTWPAFTGFAGGTLTFAYNSVSADIQTAANTVFGLSSTYTGSTAPGNMSSPTTSNMKVSGDPSTKSVTFAPNNAFRLVSIPLPTVTTNTTGTVATVTNGVSVGGAGHVGVLATGTTTTSQHEGMGTVWGNGPQGQGNPGATGVALECTSCHNPHGNGQYRVLDTLPGGTWANGTAGVASWTAPTNAVEVKDGVALAAGQVRNYTTLPSTNGLTTGLVGTAADGDYWRYKYDPSGLANFTNFYLKPDEMNTGWNGTSATNAAANGTVAPANSTGLMTAWCITCHTRYNGYSTAGTTSLVPATPTDSIFMYKHGTTRVGCEQCHVSHGSNAAMTAQFSAQATFPGGSVLEDSALLKVDNRGTCQLCHDPTGTVTAGTKVGTVPFLITPGP
jgi:predicted CXXCH cytochrome family protein